MTTYTLQIDLSAKHVAHFNTQGFKLCFAAGVTTSEGGIPSYNVVASTKKVAKHVTITWKEEYAIGATDSTFSNGVSFVASTDTFPIKFKQSYTQPADFTNGTITPSGPENGFNFVNKASQAAAVVYKKVEGAWAPIYVSKKAPLPPGTEKLIPVVTCAVWFSAEAEASYMISEFNGEPWSIDLTHNESHKAVVNYSEDAVWSTVSNS